MKSLHLVAAIGALALPLSAFAVPAAAATVHNSQAGGFGSSSNAHASTPSSPRVKHSAKHKRM